MTHHSPLSTIRSILGITVVSIGLLFTYTSDHLNKLTEVYAPQTLEQLYNRSQYVVPHSKNPISDAVVYAYAGSAHMNGSNPVLLNAEHPPHGKYLIGLLFQLTGYWKSSGIIVVISMIIFILWYCTRRTRWGPHIYLLLFLLVTDTNIRYQIVGGPLLDIIQNAYSLCTSRWSISQTDIQKILGSSFLLAYRSDSLREARCIFQRSLSSSCMASIPSGSIENLSKLRFCRL